MSENKQPVLLTPKILSPEFTNFYVLLECCNDKIGCQIKAFGTKEQLKEEYGEELSCSDLKRLDSFLQDYSEDVYHQELENQKHIQQQKKYEAIIKSKFPIGSVVQLKSGGPKMTVASVSDYWNVKIHTVFYLDNREITKQEFIPDVLKIVTDKKDDNTVS